VGLRGSVSLADSPLGKKRGRKKSRKTSVPLLASRQWLALELPCCCMIFGTGSDMSGRCWLRQYLRGQRPLEVHLLRQEQKRYWSCIDSGTARVPARLQAACGGCTSGSVKDTDFGRWLAR
jgi:hypothetical protein